MTLTVIIVVYLIGCVLAYGRAKAGEAPSEAYVFIVGLSYLGLAVACCAGEWCNGFICFRDPDKLRAKRRAKHTAKQLRQEEIQRRIKANTFDFSEKTPDMYSWMQ